MLFNILPCISRKTTRGLGRGACIPVMYPVNMHHADTGVTSKGVHTSPQGSSCYTVLEVVWQAVTTSNSCKSPPVSLQCTTFLNLLFGFHTSLMGSNSWKCWVVFSGVV